MRIVNKEELSVGDMTQAMLERQPLPIGKTQFMEWSDRIISGAHVEASYDSLRFSLAAMLMHIGPTEAFREDAFFILQLRKAAVNQTAHSMMEELKQKQAEETDPKQGVVNESVLENKTV